MFYCYTKASTTRPWNEDRCFVCKDFGFVLDGVSVNGGQKFSSYNSDAEWFSNRWKEYLKDNLSNTTKTLADIMRNGIDLIVKEYKAMAGKEDIIYFPALTITMFRVVDNELQYFYLGDSEMLLKSKSGHVIQLLSEGPNLMDWENEMALTLLDTNKEGLIPVRKKQDANFILNVQKHKKNTEGYYWVISDREEAIKHASYGVIDKNIIDSIILVSDGFGQIYNLFEIIDKNKMFKLNSEKIADKYYRKLYKAQEKDKYAKKYLRIKVRDDSTIVYYQF